MKLIVGLGNPGDVYANSRHNVGFLLINALFKKYKFSLKRDSGVSSMSVRGFLGGQEVILAKPLTFMNLSGAAVKNLVKKYKISLEDLLVIYDDLDLEPGRLKIKVKGLSAGHKGVQSIIDQLGSSEWPRLRVGIGRPFGGMPAAKYVLAPFTKKEKSAQITDNVIACCEVWLERGITEAMNEFN